ncbi:MAG: hypothetical protein AB7F96_01865 [Beijerinckiaceae bacterium]
MKPKLLFAPLTAAIAAGAFAALPAQGAGDDLSWDYLNDRNYMTLTLRHTDPKAPLPFLAACEDRGDVKITLGAPLDKVKAAGESVTITLESAGKTAAISGKAVFNQFTKVMELAVETKTDNPVFSLLTTGQPVKLTSPARSDTVWPAPDVERAHVWINDCTTRSEH